MENNTTESSNSTNTQCHQAITRSRGSDHPALLVTNKVVTMLGLVHHSIGEDPEAVASVPLTNIAIGYCEFERIQKYRVLQKLPSFLRTKATMELDQLCQGDLGQPAVGFQSISIHCPLKLLWINFT